MYIGKLYMIGYILKCTAMPKAIPDKKYTRSYKTNDLFIFEFECKVAVVMW